MNSFVILKDVYVYLFIFKKKPNTSWKETHRTLSSGYSEGGTEERECEQQAYFSPCTFLYSEFFKPLYITTL